MLDRFDREINYLRISVTSSCELRCTYCVPENYRPPPTERVLSLEEIIAVVKAGAGLGLAKIRLTGGEPLLRPDIVQMVAEIKQVEKIDELAITTNGHKLPVLAAPLVAAGLDRLNISLDTVNPERYRTITRYGTLGKAISGIDAALAAKIPVKINMVVLTDTTDGQIAEMREFCDSRGLQMQLIRQYSLKETKLDEADYDRPPPCSECNRIRLLSNGTLKPCLHTDVEIDLDPDRIEECLVAAVNAKPVRGAVCSGRDMVEIGG